MIGRKQTNPSNHSAGVPDDLSTMDASPSRITSADEVAEHLDVLGLVSVEFEDYLFVMDRKFDAFISGEPYHARTMLLSTKTGRIISRVWNKTVTVGHMVTLQELEEECIRHFRGGKLCLGSFEQTSEQDNPNFCFLISQTPVPRRISKYCSIVLPSGNFFPTCDECLKVKDLKYEMNILTKGDVQFASAAEPNPEGVSIVPPVSLSKNIAGKKTWVFNMGDKPKLLPPRSFTEITVPESNQTQLALDPISIQGKHRDKRCCWSK